MSYPLLFVFLLNILLGCNGANQLPRNHGNTEINCLHEGEWYFNFKNEVFIATLKKLYGEQFTKFIDSADASSSADLDWLDYNKEVISAIDSIAENFAKSQEAKWEIEGGKITMNVCLGYRYSKELDSLAVMYFKKYR